MSEALEDFCDLLTKVGITDQEPYVANFKQVMEYKEQIKRTSWVGALDGKLYFGASLKEVENQILHLPNSDTCYIEQL